MRGRKVNPDMRINMIDAVIETAEKRINDPRYNTKGHFWSVNKVCRIFNICRNTFYSWVDKGIISDDKALEEDEQRRKNGQQRDYALYILLQLKEYRDKH